MAGCGLVFALAVLVFLAALVAPLLVDAQHWWPRKRITLKTRQAFQTATFLLCISLALRITSGLDGTEFSGGWLSGPLLSMTDIGIGLFMLAIVWTFFSQRVAAAIGLVSSLFCLPLCCFFIAPVPFARIFAHGHGFKVQPAPGFHWHTWSVAALLAVVVAGYNCIRDFAARTPIRQ
jgi:hypothetical protein